MVSKAFIPYRGSIDGPESMELWVFDCKDGPESRLADTLGVCEGPERKGKSWLSGLKSSRFLSLSLPLAVMIW